MWKPQDTGWGRRSWIVKRSFTGPNGTPCCTVDTFLYKGYDWRYRKFASKEAAQKRCDELNGAL